MNAKRWFAGAIATGVAAMALPISTATALDVDTEISAEDAPDALTHQGRLVDDDGQPITGEVELTYTLWDHPTEGAVVWEDVVDVDVDETGFYSVELGGEDNPIDAAVVADGQGWLGVAVDGGDELDPRISLNAVPYALVAEEALRAGTAEYAENAFEAQTALEADTAATADVASEVEAGSIGTEALADDFQVNPEHVEEATGQTLGGLSCSDGDITKFDGTDWSCDDTVAAAQFADEAGHAEEADWAEVAEHAEEADWAEVADEADHADEADWAEEAGHAAVATEVEETTIGGLSCASNEVARFDGTDWFCDTTTEGTITAVTADAPLASSGGTEPNITLARADAGTSGYLHADDYESFDDRVEDVEEGTGISLEGNDTIPEVNVEFGTDAGTVAEGDDPRLSDARPPEPDSDYYIQNDPSSPQDASIDIDGNITVDGYVDESEPLVDVGFIEIDSEGTYTIDDLGFTPNVIELRAHQRVPGINEEYTSPQNSSCSNALGHTEGWAILEDGDVQSQLSLSTSDGSDSPDAHRARSSNEYAVNNVYVDSGNASVCGRLRAEVTEGLENGFELEVEERWVDEVIMYKAER